MNHLHNDMDRQNSAVTNDIQMMEMELDHNSDSSHNYGKVSDKIQLDTKISKRKNSGT